MDVEKKIQDLLFFKDCVIIPGFGGFVSHYQPARIREETQSFIPPAKQIGFNADLTHDDGVLSGFIAGTGNVPSEIARAAIDEYVYSLKKKLITGETVRLNSIGSFAYGKTGELEFSASRDVNFLAESFGLSPFHFPRLVPDHQHPLLRTALLKNRAGERTLSLPGIQDMQLHRSNLRRIAMALPLLVVISLLPVNSRHGLNKSQYPASVFPLRSLYAPEKPGPETAAIEPSIDEAPSAENLVEDVKQTLPDVKFFAIVAGSFSSEKNAQALAGQLGNKGFSSEIWKAANGFFRVVVQTHKDLTHAQDAANKLREDLPGIDFWVLR